MAFWRRGDVGEAFRRNQQLQQFMLTGVTPNGRVLGTGSYGSVEEVTYNHITCAGKRLHETLIDAENEGVAEVIDKYLKECQLMSSLHHPNITQFLGLCFLPGTQLPLLVMERLETSLDDLLEHMPNLPLSLKRSVLEDVASGLLYLHNRPSPVIHRDLTSKNVLLTCCLVAKITDMGNSRMIAMGSGQMARTLTNQPGTSVYMPPEALDNRSRYGPPLDIFSFGHLALFTITQVFPGCLLPSTFLNPDNPGEVQGRTELERREQYIDLLESRILSSSHPDLIQLVKQCLHNDPQQRPNTDELLTRLQRMKVEVEGEYGGGPIKLDMVRVRLAKEVKMKDRRIEELETNEARVTREMEMKDRRAAVRDEQIATIQREIANKDGQIATMEGELTSRDERITAMEGELANRDERITAMERELAAMEGELTNRNERMSTMEEELAIRDERLATTATLERQNSLTIQQLEEQLRSRDQEIRRIGEELRKCQLEGVEQVPQLKFPLRLYWRCGPDMPFEMADYIQSVVVQGRVYVGGGYAYDRGRIIIEYNASSEKWAELPSYMAESFGMTVINNQLVLVGGCNSCGFSKVLGVWGTDSRRWTHPYPEMPTARSLCSPVVYKEWLIVAGGASSRGRVSSVEVMNTDTRQWHTGQPTPTPWRSMKTAIIGDMCYFMGGYTSRSDYLGTDSVYCASLPAVVSQAQSQVSRENCFQEIRGLGKILSSPLSISGSLLAVGGRDVSSKSDITAIHLYQPDTEEWVKVGDLPTPCSNYTCAMISEREILVAGGYSGLAMEGKTINFALIPTRRPN